MSKFGRKLKNPPNGFEYIEPTLTALDNELREKVNEPHEGLRKTEAQWPVHQINWQKSRYVYDMFYTYQRISREVYEFCIKNKLVDAALIAKWKKAGYERLCSTYVINPRNYKFGTVSICRVPKYSLAEGTQIEDPVTGCRGCASGPGGNKNIFGNKYGQYLAAIQIARENRDGKRHGNHEDEDNEDEDEDEEDNEEDLNKNDNNNQNKKRSASNHSDNNNDNNSDDDDDNEPVGEIDGSSNKKASIWAQNDEEDKVEIPEEVMGVLTGEAEKEARRAAGNASNSSSNDNGNNGPIGKKQRVS